MPVTFSNPVKSKIFEEYDRKGQYSTTTKSKCIQYLAKILFSIEMFFSCIELTALCIPQTYAVNLILDSRFKAHTKSTYEISLIFRVRQ